MKVNVLKQLLAEPQRVSIRRKTPRNKIKNGFKFFSIIIGECGEYY